MKTHIKTISDVLSKVAIIVLFPFALAYAGLYRLVRMLVRSAWGDGNLYYLPLEKRERVMRMLDRQRSLTYVMIEAANLVGRMGDSDTDALRRLGRSAGRDLKRVQRWLQFRHFINKGDVVRLSEKEAGLFSSRFC